MGDGWEDWEWDESLFRGSAAHYDRGRLPYAPELPDVLADALGLDGTGHLLDVGCGPGTVTLRVAHVFASVVGVDADAEMLDEARRLAAIRGVANATWVRARAEHLPEGLGTFRVITFAASFHWMDRPLVARAVRDLLDPDGVVVHVDNRHQDSLAETDLPPLPRSAIDELRTRYLGPLRRAGASVRTTSPDDEDRVFREAGFAGPRVEVVPDGRTIDRTIDEVVAEVFSMSSTAPHLFGDRLRSFEHDLRAVLIGTSPTGRFGVRLPDNRLRIWQPA